MITLILFLILFSTWTYLAVRPKRYKSCRLWFDNKFWGMLGGKDSVKLAMCATNFYSYPCRYTGAFYYLEIEYKPPGKIFRSKITFRIFGDEGDWARREIGCLYLSLVTFNGKSVSPSFTRVDNNGGLETLRNADRDTIRQIVIELTGTGPVLWS